MDPLRERIDAYAHLSAKLVVQLNELDELREQVRQAQLSLRDAQVTELARMHDLPVHAPIRRRALLGQATRPR
jgi:hypothetical protein